MSRLQRGRLASLGLRFATTSADRFQGRVANPFDNLDRVKHWHMILMCICCGGVGIMVGKYVDIDEDTLRRIVVAPFDREAIEAEFKKMFEFRPELAATFIRLAFADAARRGERAKVIPPPSGAYNRDLGFNMCRGERGLEEVRKILDTLHEVFPNVGLMDLSALAAISAVRFLRGPADKIEFMWGRGDTGIVKEEPKGIMQYITEQPVDDKGINGRFLSGGSGSNAIFARLHALVPTLNFEEAMALVGSHCVGEFHPDVSGINGVDFNRMSRHKFFLGNHYFQLLVDHSKPGMIAPAELEPAKSITAGRITPITVRDPSTAAAQTCPVPPKMLVASAVMKHPVTGKEVTRRALITEEEMQCVALDADGVEVATAFAMDNGMWQQYYASGMTKLLNVHCESLKKYVSAKDVEVVKSQRGTATELARSQYGSPRVPEYNNNNNNTSAGAGGKSS